MTGTSDLWINTYSPFPRQNPKHASAITNMYTYILIECQYFSFPPSSSKLFGVSHPCPKLLLVPISHIIWPVPHIILKLRISIAYNHVIFGLPLLLFPPVFISINILTASGSKQSRSNFSRFTHCRNHA